MTTVRYTLSMPSPNSHLFHVRIEVKRAPGEVTDFVMPVWTPGSYKVRDFAKNVQDFSAGRRAWKKVDKSRWRVQAGGNVTIGYDLWAFDLTVDTSHLDADHGYVNGASVFMYVDGHKDAPIEVAVRAPRGWKVATGMDKRGGFWTAADYDILVDSPLEIGTFRKRTFRVRRVPHHLVIHGKCNADEARLVRDVKKLVETEIRIMRHVPYRHYTFILHNTFERGGGGLEHLNSTSLQYPPNGYRPAEKYGNFLELVAHEFWHLWNVKRIHPEMLGPFDYEREVYTTLLWVMEGITSFYDSLVPCRAGLVTPERYLKKTGDRIQRYLQKPGRLRQSLTQSSFDTWISLYQSNENSINSQMSYYEKGELVGLCLDLEIRKRTRNRKSLDDVMRLLYAEHGRKGRGFPEPEFKIACERVAGKLDRFFADYVKGTVEVPWSRFLGHAGLRLVRQPQKREGGERPKRSRPWLGVITRKSGQTTTIASVLQGSPAQTSGLSARDELVALDDARVVPEEWERRIAERSPGDRMRVAFFRSGYLREVTVTLGGRDNTTLVLKKVKKPTSLQKRIYEGWIWMGWKSEARNTK